MAALEASLPTIFLIGFADSSSENFLVDMSMSRVLSMMINVERAQASFDEDRVRIIAQVEARPGIGMANAICRSAVQGAYMLTNCPELISAAMGDPSPLAAIRNRDGRLRHRFRRATGQPSGALGRGGHGRAR